MSTSKHCRLLILGSGPAGWTAAVYAARANLKPVVVTGLQQGGQLMTTTEVDNWPGDAHGLMGPDLMARMQAHAERFETEVIFDHIHTADLSKRPFKLIGDSGEYTADALIIATGATAKYLGLPSEEAFKGRGVSYCATCDGFFYRDKTVAVVGGGDAAVGEALYLTRFANKVYIIHRRHELRAQKIVQERALRDSKIEMVWNSVVTAVLGQEQVTGLRIKNIKTGEESTLAVDGMFSYIGNIPNTKLFEGQLQLDDQGYIVTDRNMHTSVPGVFAAGDVQERVLKQVSTAVGSGAMAAMEAEKFIAELEGHAYPERQS